MPKEYNGKPLEVEFLKEQIRLADAKPPIDSTRYFFGPVAKPLLLGACDYIGFTRQGGLPVTNRRVNPYGYGTLGGAVYGRGWPTNNGWKYLVSDQHVLADANGNQADDIIDQPSTACSGFSESQRRIGYLGGIPGQGIPTHLRVRWNNPGNPNYTDAAVAYLVSNNALSATIRGIGTPTGWIDPPQIGWCGNASAATSGVQGGCINDYPLTIYVPWLNNQLAWFTDIFKADNCLTSGDSGALWLDYDRRVHGMYFAGAGCNSYFQRWQHVHNGWTITIATY